MQLVTEWEKEHRKQFPDWALVWHYDAYGECWVTEKWYSVKAEYENLRKETPCENAPMWQYYYEPMVALPTDDYCKSGIPLKRCIK